MAVTVFVALGLVVVSPVGAPWPCVMTRPVIAWPYGVVLTSSDTAAVYLAEAR